MGFELAASNCWLLSPPDEGCGRSWVSCTEEESIFLEEPPTQDRVAFPKEGSELPAWLMPDKGVSNGYCAYTCRGSHSSLVFPALLAHFRAPLTCARGSSMPSCSSCQWPVSPLFHNILGRIPPAFLHLHVRQPFILRACHRPSRTGPGRRYHQETLYY